jgi:hypothetical protein
MALINQSLLEKASGSRLVDKLYTIQPRHAKTTNHACTLHDCSAEAYSATNNEPLKGSTSTGKLHSTGMPKTDIPDTTVSADQLLHHSRWQISFSE